MPQEIKATDSARLENVKLAGNTAMLNEVVVVGYGTQSEKLLTTSISSLKVDDIDQGNEYNVAKMLQGRTPGVSVASGNGTPGKQPNVRVRGIASISGNSTPLYVVDGIPTGIHAHAQPHDIERMDVLKDASATAIYGSRANSGVIIITTKSGKTNSTTDVSASVRHAIGWIANDIKMANSAQYIRTMQQAVDNYNVQFLGLSEPKEFFIPDVIDDTDWVGLIQRERAHTTNANISVRGGTGKTTFFTSVGYNGQEGILRKSKLDQVNAPWPNSRTRSAAYSSSTSTCADPTAATTWSRKTRSTSKCSALHARKHPGSAPTTPTAHIPKTAPNSCATIL